MTRPVSLSATRTINQLETHRAPALIPEHFSRKIAPGDITGPLARQVVPSPEELLQREGFTPDPVGDASADMGHGLLVKYDGRALLLTTSTCAIHCRFCFRSALNRSRPTPDSASRLAALETLGTLENVRELILSGGDPLTLSNSEMKTLLDIIDTIPHIVRIRIHTRMLTAAPSRIDTALARMLGASTKAVVFVTHVNHPDELDRTTAEAVLRLKTEAGRAGKTPLLLLNQSVLLKGVNDDAGTLVALSEKLVAQGILPYYLHQLDRASGTHHFEVPLEQGRRLIETLRRKCPGYMVPRYVQELEGEASKTAIR